MSLNDIKTARKDSWCVCTYCIRSSSCVLAVAFGMGTWSAYSIYSGSAQGLASICVERLSLPNAGGQDFAP